MSNPNGRFGVHGGQYVPETLMNAIIELEEAYNYYKANPDFQNELTQLLNDYAGRPSRLYYAEKMTKDLGGAKIYLKREDLNHTGAHKINNVLGQALLAKKMGKTRLIAETGAGQHGVATATAAALMGMECVVFMGKEDTIRQALNVYRMRLLGATVVPVTSGTATLKDAPEMIENAIQLAEEENADCCFQVMDAENPMFADETFDVVISRNLTWTLPNAEHAYGEWMRVLKTGGVLLNFDANYGKEDVADTKGLPEAHAHFKVGNEMLEECERIKSQLPISRKNRPAYDVAVLCENTAGEIRIDTSLGKRIYLEKDEFYNPAPMFSICAVKQ